MSEPRRPPHPDHEETIAAFDREREEAHELKRRHQEIITNSRRNDRPVRPEHDQPHR